MRRAALGLLLAAAAAGCSPRGSRPGADEPGRESIGISPGAALPAGKPGAGDVLDEEAYQRPAEECQVSPGPGADAGQPKEPRPCWLARHQSADGSWDPDPAAHPCGCLAGENRPSFGKVGTTGLVLFSFLEQGETHRTPRYGSLVRAGLKFLKNVQREDGSFVAPEGPAWVREHALATMAMGEAYNLTQSPLFKSAARSGADCAQRLHEPWAGWSATGPPGPSDLETTTWMLMALLCGATADHPVERGLFREVRDWIEREYPETRLVEGSEIAMAATARWLCLRGEARERDATTGIQAELLADRLPTEVEGLRRLDGRTLWLGSFVLFQEENARWMPWRRACRKLFAAPEEEAATRCDAGIFRSGRADESPIEAGAFADLADSFGRRYRRGGPSGR